MTKLYPAVTVVIPTHNRPDEVRHAISTVQQQDYPGPVETLVVFDRADPDLTLQSGGDRPVRILENNRTPGLAGARNTGILASSGDLVAFCDDDDYWSPTKLRRQAEALSQMPDAPLVSTAIVVEYEGRSTPRRAGCSLVSHEMLTRSRMAMLHSSTLVFRRGRLYGDLGLINEEIPGSQNEDWDILLRASALHPVVHVDEPLVHVRWGRASFFSRRWDTKIASSEWMLSAHPAVAQDNRAAARLMGQIAFAHACNGDRRKAWVWSARTAQRYPAQWRWLLASAVALFPRSGEIALGTLHRFGRGV